METERRLTHAEVRLGITKDNNLTGNGIIGRMKALEDKQLILERRIEILSLLRDTLQ